MSVPISPRRRTAAAAAGAVVFVALVIAAFGLSSLALDEDVIEARGLGQVPGVVAVAVSTAAVAAVIWSRMPRAGIWATIAVAALAGFLGYLGGLLVAGAVAAPDLAIAVAAVGRAATSWPGLVVAAAAAAAAAMSLAVARGAGAQARWPWERDDDR